MEVFLDTKVSHKIIIRCSFPFLFCGNTNGHSTNPLVGGQVREAASARRTTRRFRRRRRSSRRHHFRRRCADAVQQTCCSAPRSPAQAPSPTPSAPSVPSAPRPPGAPHRRAPATETATASFQRVCAAAPRRPRARPRAATAGTSSCRWAPGTPVTGVRSFSRPDAPPPVTALGGGCLSRQAPQPPPLGVPWN